MTLKIFEYSSWSVGVFLLFTFGYIQMSNAGQSCDFYRKDDPKTYTKQCPDICCPYAKYKRGENNTCCVSSDIYLTMTPPYSLFGYSWWTLFVCAICTSISLSILIHYLKRLHIFKNSRHFNSIIEPSAAFTISKSALNLRLNDGSVYVEQNPPSYINSTRPSPPPYASVKTVE